MVQTSGFSLEAFESKVAMIAPYPPQHLSHHEREKNQKARCPQSVARQ
jgi:hypothetical protein